jgi:hypothetical protein
MRAGRGIRAGGPGLCRVSARSGLAGLGERDPAADRHSQPRRESQRRCCPVTGDSGAGHAREGTHLGDPGDFVPGAGRVKVFPVTMRAHFVANAAPGPPRAAAPVGRYLSIVADARTFQVLDSGLSPKPPPLSPASLRPVTSLTDHRH